VADGAAVTALAEGTPPGPAVREALGRLLALVSADESMDPHPAAVDDAAPRVSDS
jgi:hypothetical protein